MFPPKPNMPFGGDIFLAYLRNIYEWELGSRRETYFHSNFYETRSILHFNRKWEREFKSDTPDARSDCIHLTIISNQCCVLIFLM